MTFPLLREAILKLVNLGRARRHERELADELEFHRAMKQQSYQSSSPTDAARAANRDFGGFEKWKEICRDTARPRLLEDFLRDLALALRMLRKSPVFTAVALATLTTAIGANTAIFSLMNVLMLKTLAVPHPDRLAILRIQPDENYGYTFSYPLFKELQRNTTSVMTVFAFTSRNLQWNNGDGVEAIHAQLVSGQYFPALGVNPQLGRWINSRDDRPGAPDGMVAVVGDRFWRTHLHAEPNVIGRHINLNRGVFTIIGVMPKAFRGMDKDELPDVFIPFELEPFVDAPFNNIAGGYFNWWFALGARLNNGVSLQRATAFLRTNSPQYFKPVASNSNFKLNGHNLKDLYLIAEPGSNGLSYLRLQFHKPLTVLMGLVSLVLLIACLNLATLLMARAASRNREISTRFALGASRARLLRQLLTESLLLALAGTALGLALSPLLARFLAAMLAPQHDPNSVPLDVTPDLMVFTFTALIAIVATVLTGTLPAFRSTKPSVQTALREGSVSLRSVDRRQLWPRFLLVFEVALSLVLVTGASLLGYSLVQLHRIPIGFEPRSLVYLPLDLRNITKGPEAPSIYRSVTSELQPIPGVTAVSTTAIIPLSMSWSTSDQKVPGGVSYEIWSNTVGPAYFAAMRTPLLQGREFRWNDSPASGQKAILNVSAAKLLFPKGNALGNHLQGQGKSLIEVVGIVADAKYQTLRDTPPPTMYTPITQQADNPYYFLLLRTTGAPGPIIEAARKIIHRTLPQVAIPNALSMQDTVDESIATERIMATLALFFGALALLITAIGLYGTLAYATERRTGEIGIRLALGAPRSNVITLVCTENTLIALLGCLAGIAISAAAAKTISSFLYGVSATNPLLFALAAILLLAVATAASLVPAIRASQIDPIAAIRYE